ncbi:MAG: hypothetical protein KJ043_01970 [Anaerolineae bacterium]|nr:hypothetical protein [Anaerolineae bacterium]
MRLILAMCIFLLTFGGVFAQETTPPAEIAPQILIQMNTLNPWAIMNGNMTEYNTTTFTLYDDGTVIYYAWDADTRESNYYTVTIDADEFMAQFDLAELATLDDKYTEENLMDASTNILKIYIPETDDYKTIDVYGYDIPDSLQLLLDTIWDFTRAEHEDALLWTPRFVWIHLFPETDLTFLDESLVADVELDFLFEEAFAGQVEMNTPETLEDGLKVMLWYDIYFAELAPLLDGKMYIRTSRTQVWYYSVEVVSFLP